MGCTEGIRFALHVAHKKSCGEGLTVVAEQGQRVDGLSLGLKLGVVKIGVGIPLVLNEVHETRMGQGYCGIECHIEGQWG